MRYQKWGKHDSKIVCYSTDKSKIHLVKNPDCDNVKQWASDIENAIINFKSRPNFQNAINKWEDDLVFLEDYTKGASVGFGELNKK